MKSDIYLLLKELYESSQNKKFNGIVKKGIEYIEKNLSGEIKISDISKSVGVSVNYFQTIFKETMGVTPNSYIFKKSEGIQPSTYRAKNFFSYS